MIGVQKSALAMTAVSRKDNIMLLAAMLNVVLFAAAKLFHVIALMKINYF
jgi:hypothetical protein